MDDPFVSRMRRLRCVLAASLVIAGLSLLPGTAARSQTADATAKSRTVVVQYLEQIIKGRRLEAADRLIAPDIAQHVVPAVPAGLDGFKRHYAKLFKRFREYNLDVSHMVAEGDLVTVYGRLHGVTRGNSRIDFRVADVYRVAGGKIAERWRVRQIIEPD